MSGIQGYPTSGKLDNNTEDKVKKEFVTLQPLGSNKHGLNTVNMGFYNLALLAVVEAGSTDKILKKTAHGLKKGDLVRLQTTANSIEEGEIGVLKVIDADNVELTAVLSASLTAGDTVDFYRPITQELTSTGAISLASLQYILDGVKVDVIEDTVTPANNQPLPVKLTGVTGDVNITANDLNVQLQHSGATPDSTQIGDGTTLLGITLSNEAKTFDATTHTKLDTIAALDFATETTQATLATQATAAAILAKIIAAPSTEAKQDTVITALASLLTELQAKADLTETQPVSAIALPLPTGASTSALQTTGNASLAVIEGDTTSIDGKLPATIGQKANAASLAVTMSTEQEALLTTIAGDTTSIDAKTPALGQAAAAASVPVVLANDVEVINEGWDVVDLTAFVDVASTNIPASAASPLQIVASTAAIIKKVQTVEDVGEFIGLYTGAAAAETLLCYLPIAGGEVEVNIPAGTRLSIRNMKNATISTSTYFAANFIG